MSSTATDTLLDTESGAAEAAPKALTDGFHLFIYDM